MRAKHIVQGVEHLGDAQFLGIVDGRDEILPEVPQQFAPVHFACGHCIEFFFQAGCEVVLDVAVEELLQEGRYHAPLVLWHEPVPIHMHVLTIPQGAEGRGVGGGAADAEFFHPPHQRGFREAGRGLGEMLICVDGYCLWCVALRELRQALAVVVAVRVVNAFLIQGQKTIEDEHGTGRAHADFAVGICEFDGCALEAGALHLAGNRPLPDKFIKLQLFIAEIAGHVLRGAGKVGRTDGFMRFLRVLCLGLVDPRTVRQVLAAELMSNGITGCVNRLRRHLHAVRTHIGDETHCLAANVLTLIEALGDLHRP